MKPLKIIISLLITSVMIYALDRSWGSIPPLGKFLDPFHGFWQNAEKGYPQNDQLVIPGLREEVTVVYDSLLIPHIFASNDEDLFFAQGYITARHRLWQMEFQTRSAAGRISEIVGAAALDYDRGQRRLGMTLGAENNLRSIEGDTILFPIVSKYTEGVNAYIQGLHYEDFPIEYKLLDYQPEPWTNLKAGMVQMNLSLTLNVGERDLQFTNALNVFGKETLDLLFPDREEVGDPVVGNEGNWKFDPIRLDSIPLALPEELIQLPAVETGRGIGSNNWVVSGPKTATGSAILCNDPHLSLGMPSLWFVVQLHSPVVNVMGASLAGAPSVIIGFNDSVAWGCTNAQRDLADWYQIRFKDETKNEYLSDGKWLFVKKVVEKIGLRNEQPFYDTVIFTHHGPIRYDESFHGENERNHFAFRWISHDPAEPLKAFHLLNRAKNYADYMEALDHYLCPAQNFAFASVSGDIAIRVQGKFPVRRKDEGKFILDGTKTSNEWKAFIPFEQNVMMKNPESGFLFSANQYPADASYPYNIRATEYEAYRNRRISHVLGQSADITPKDMMQLQNDNYNLQAAESLPFMLEQVDMRSLSEEEQLAVDKLRSWDFYNSIESLAAVYYDAWWNELYSSIWDEMIESKTLMSIPSEFTTIKLMKERPELPFFDIQKTPARDSLAALVKNALMKAVTVVEEWKSKNPGKTIDWSNYKDTYIQHLLRLEPFGLHARNGGNSGIVNASSHRWGPSWRMIVSLEKTGVKAWGVYPGGQSGNPGSKFYDNLMDRWEKSQPPRLKFFSSVEKLSKAALCTTILKPAGK